MYPLLMLSITFSRFLSSWFVKPFSALLDASSFNLLASFLSSLDGRSLEFTGTDITRFIRSLFSFLYRSNRSLTSSSVMPYSAARSLIASLISAPSLTNASTFIFAASGESCLSTGYISDLYLRIISASFSVMTSSFTILSMVSAYSTLLSLSNTLSTKLNFSDSISTCSCSLLMASSMASVLLITSFFSSSVSTAVLSPSISTKDRYSSSTSIGTNLGLMLNNLFSLGTNSLAIPSLVPMLFLTVFSLLAATLILLLYSASANTLAM